MKHLKLILACLLAVAMCGQAHAAFTLIDDFNDNSLDTGIWSETDAGSNVNEQNQRMEITGDNNWNTNGIVTKTSWGHAANLEVKGVWNSTSAQFMLFGFNTSSTLSNAGTGGQFNFTSTVEGAGFQIRVLVNGSALDVGAEVYKVNNLYNLRVAYDGANWDFYIQSDTDSTYSTETLVYTTAASVAGNMYFHAQVFTSGSTAHLDDVEVQSPVISITNLQDNMIFQRDASAGTGSIPLSGGYDGSPTAIECQVVLDGTSTQVKDWTTVDASPSGGTWSGTLTGVPEGTSGGTCVFYNIDCRWTDTPANLIESSLKIGLGGVYIYAGQSNALNAFTNGSDDTASACIRWLDDGVWEDPGSTGNGANAFGNALVTAYNVPIALVDQGKSGAALTNRYQTNLIWIDGTPGSPTDGQAFDLLVDSFTIGGIPLKSEGVVFICGEADAFTTGTTTYDTDFSTFIASWLRGRFSNGSKATNLPVVFSQINKYTQAATTDSEWQAVRDDQTSFSLADTRLVSTIDLDMLDFAHWSNASQTTVGKRFANSMLQLNGDANCSGRLGASYEVIDSDTIDIRITHSCGTDLTPTGATSATTFTVLDDGSPITVNSALRQDASTYRLELASAYSGTLTVRYNWGKQPTTTNAIKDNFATVSYSLESLGSIDVYVPPAAASSNSRCSPQLGTSLACGSQGTPLYQGVPNSTPGTSCFSGVSSDGVCYH